MKMERSGPPDLELHRYINERMVISTPRKSQLMQLHVAPNVATLKLIT